jgi:hypothetical protein
MTSRSIISVSLAVLLSACGSGGTVRSAPAAPAKAPIRTPAKTPVPKPRIYAAPGLEGVIGAAPDDVIRQFGAARLDVWEGDARKLQFSGTACVLDVYFYPPAAGREPEATYLEARRASDGQDVDRAACVAALRGK